MNPISLSDNSRHFHVFLEGARRKITFEQSSVWQMINHGFSKGSHAFLFTQYSWSDSTMALSTSSVQVHNSLNSQTIHSYCLFCAGINSYVAVLWKWSFSLFLWDKCSATLVSIQHCFGLYWLWNSPLIGTVRKRSLYQYSKPIFTMSFILCSAWEKRTSQK